MAMNGSRPSYRQLHAAEDFYAGGGGLEDEAQRITALPTRIEWVLALAEIAERKPEGWGWILGRCVRLWAAAIAALPDRDARRQALQEIPPGQSRLVETEVRRLFETRRQEAGA